MPTSRSFNHRGGVTLVELLVVIAIIGILAAILIPTIAAAIRRAKLAAMATELNQLNNSIEAYKSKFNDYPPDFTNVVAVQQHIRRAFPRAAVDLNPASAASWWNAPPWQTALPTLDPKTLDPAEALVFWLSAIKNNARDPLDIDNAHPVAVYDGAGDPVSFFEFDQSRLTDVDNDGWPEYSPKEAPEAPYVYFDGRLQGGAYLYGTEDTTQTAPDNFVCRYRGPGGIGTARPYRTNTPVDARDNNRTYPQTTDNPTTWLEPGKFQIICAGLDANYGADVTNSGALVFKQFPDLNYAIMDEDRDNLASFSSGNTIGDSVP